MDNKDEQNNAGSLCNIEMLKSRLSGPVEQRVGAFDIESNFFSGDFLHALNDSLTSIPREVNIDGRLYVNYLRVATKAMKGTRQIKTRKAKRRLKRKK